ncbi:MAG TPA: TIM barrel protein, partial [Streptosporangiaceae bacterium]
LSDIGICLETGHMSLGGGDPAARLGAWADRINHVHLKDVVLDVMTAIIADNAPVTDIWSREAFCQLGHGDLNVAEVLSGLRATGFEGWLVVEQDILPRTAKRFAQAAQDQRDNRAFLASLGL